MEIKMGLVVIKEKKNLQGKKKSKKKLSTYFTYML